MRQALAPALSIAAGLVTVAACGGGSSAGTGGSSASPAQCARAQAAAGKIEQIAHYFTSVTSTSDVMSADMSVAADSSITGTEASDPARIAAAEAGAPKALAVPLQQLSADYQTMQADINGQAAPSTIAQDATATVGDVSKISNVCR